MKLKKIAVFLFIFMVCVIFCGCFEDTTQEIALLRVHVRANSNDVADQNVKLKVRDCVNAYLTERLTKTYDYDKAVQIVKGSVTDLTALANGTLKANGFSYRAKIRVGEEFFPARAYGDYVVKSGTYQALIVELGLAKGDNWWCVIYPPLCYTPSGKDVKYKSKIAEFIKKYFGE